MSATKNILGHVHILRSMAMLYGETAHESFTYLLNATERLPLLLRSLRLNDKDALKQVRLIKILCEEIAKKATRLEGQIEQEAADAIQIA